MSPPSGHLSGWTRISAGDTGAGTGSTGAEPGARGDGEYASDTASDDNTEQTEHSTEEGENISEVTCDNNTIEEEAVTPDRHFLDSDTDNEWRQDEDTSGEDRDSEEDKKKETYSETNEKHEPSSHFDDASSDKHDNIETFKEEKSERKIEDCNHNKDQIMTEVSPNDIDDIGNMKLLN